jgi:hypothetical protein
MISARYRAAKVLKKGASLRDAVKFLLGFFTERASLWDAKIAQFRKFCHNYLHKTT